MRYFLSCLQSSRGRAAPAHDFWGRYFKRGIEEAGHSWIEAEDADWAEGLKLQDGAQLREWRDRTWLEALRVMRERGADVFLGYLFPQMVDPAAIAEIRRQGIATVQFFCDNVREFRRLPPAFACFDLHWVPEFEALGLYQRAGAKHVFAPMPCWIPRQLRRADHLEAAEVTFAGSFDPLRRHLLGNTIRDGADILIAGSGWRDGRGDRPAAAGGGRGMLQLLRNQRAFVSQHGLLGWIIKLYGMLRPLPQPPIPESRLLGTVSEAEYVRLVQQSKVTLGVNRAQTFRRSLHRPLTYSRLRDIEAPMLGACYLTEWSEGLPHLYDVGHHVEAYRTAEELREKIDTLLADPQRRRQLRTRGQEHALGELSVPRSLEKIGRALGIPARPSP